MTTTETLPADVAQPDAPITALAPVERAQVALKSTDTEFHLLTLVSKHTGLVEIKDKAGREQVHGAAMELMRARTGIKARGDEVREDAKKFNSAVIAEQARLIAIVEPEEQRLKALRDAWDAEQERIKREAEEKVRQRVLDLGARIQEIRGFAKLANDCRTSDAVRRLVDRLAGLDMTGFEEFEAEAVKVYAETRQQVENTLNARLATEAEAARLKAEREELDRQQAEAKRQADELAAQQKAEAEKLAAERAEIERMRAEMEAIKASIPAEKTPLANLVDQLADTGIALADDLLGAPTCCENGPPGGVCEECADTSAAYQADMAPVREVDAMTAGLQIAQQESRYIPHVGAVKTDAPAAEELAQIASGFDTAMSVRIAAPTPGIFSNMADDDTPPAAGLIGAIAQAYGVDNETACHWLCVRADDFLEWVDTPTTA